MQPPIGPDSTRPTGWRQVRSTDKRPPFEPIMKSEPRKPFAVKVAFEPANVGVHLRSDIGIGRDRRGALVLVPFARQFGASR